MQDSNILRVKSALDCGVAGEGLRHIRIGKADVDFAARIIETDNRAASIEPKVMAVLKALVDCPGEVVSREDLIADIWDVRYGGDERLSRAISILRHALGDSGGQQAFIETIPKQGYRLIKSVSKVDSQATTTIQPTPRPAIAPHSIAVMPFADMTGHECRQYMGDGIAEEIINTLTHVPDLHVAGRISSFALRDAGLDLREVAAKLGVAFVMEGSVRQSGDVTRITAQLICAEDGFHRWSEEFDGSAERLFALYEDVAAATARKVAQVLGLEHEVVSIEAGHRDDDIYELFLRGRSATHQRDGEKTLPMAIDLLGQVVERDPTFPEAWAFLAIAHYFMLEYRHTADWRHHLAEARVATEQAEKLAPDAPTTMVPRLFAAAHEGRLDRHAELVEDLSQRMPGQTLAEFHLSTTLAGCGLMRQGLEHLEHALAKEPLSMAGSSLLGTARHILGQAKSSEEPYLEAFDQGLMPAGVTAVWLLADRGMTAEAERILNDRFEDLRALFESLFGWAARPSILKRAIVHRAEWARSLLALAMKRRIGSGLVQPNAGALLVPIIIGRPELFMLACRKVSATYLPGTLAHLWGDTQEARQLREHPDFSAFAKEMGMPEVWRKFGWPEGIDPAVYDEPTKAI